MTPNLNTSWGPWLATLVGPHPFSVPLRHFLHPHCISAGRDAWFLKHAKRCPTSKPLFGGVPPGMPDHCPPVFISLSRYTKPLVYVTNVIYTRGLQQQTLIYPSFGGWALRSGGQHGRRLVRALFLACTQPPSRCVCAMAFPGCAHAERERSHPLPLLTKALTPPWGPRPHDLTDLIPSQRPHLQIPSPCTTNELWGQNSVHSTSHA